MRPFWSVVSTLITEYYTGQQVLDCERHPAKIYALERIVNLFYLLATTTKGQVAFCGYARLVRVRQLRQILPLSPASVRRHFVDRTPVRRKIFLMSISNVDFHYCIFNIYF